MSRKAINPESMYPSVHFGFSHATESTDGKLIHLAGQVAWDASGTLIGEGDIAAQTKQVLKNIKTVLEEVGATSADVVRLRTYIVNHKPEYLESVCGEISAFYADELPAANTLIGIQSLALPELLIEIEATAQISN
ncbi:RidA family protein [Aestuariicella hydrocarbonica]|uniref:RidA family protein n=1 Tax=Pseudomaricurvus hydrocarbonicus TaxID=1470433 RepID=A0A9E5MQA3_9GAMM|nr:RidA family protein [Aestuariicella hydrocarbonica]NHO68380.1 RidA family protein [Aestuariicella hydrocarbonica]